MVDCPQASKQYSKVDMLSCHVRRMHPEYTKEQLKAYTPYPHSDNKSPGPLPTSLSRWWSQIRGRG